MSNAVTRFSPDTDAFVPMNYDLPHTDGDQVSS